VEARRVLIIDNDGYICACLSRLLAKCGIVADSAASGERGLELYSKNRYPVVICDVCLGDDNGITMIPRLMDMNPEISIIMLSAYYAPELARLALKNGAVRFLAKPFDWDELSGTVRSCLELANVGE